MIFGSKRMMDNFIEPTIGTSKIEWTTETKLLGVIINESLKWNNHIESVCTKISKSIGVIYRSRYVLDDIVVTSLYSSLIDPDITLLLLNLGSFKRVEQSWKDLYIIVEFEPPC